MTLLHFLTCIGCAAGCGLLIGIERQLTGHVAGIRVNVLVSFGACMFSLFPQVIGSADLTRVAAQIVTGVGFLCSGIIFKDGFSVRGLSTAATIWCTAAIGMLASSGNLPIAGAATLLLLCMNLLLRPLAALIQPMGSCSEIQHLYKVSATCMEDQEFAVRSMLLSASRDGRLMVSQLQSSDVIGEKVEIEATFVASGRRRDNAAEALVARIGSEKGVLGAGWQLLEK